MEVVTKVDPELFHRALAVANRSGGTAVRLDVDRESLAATSISSEGLAFSARIAAETDGEWSDALSLPDALALTKQADGELRIIPDDATIRLEADGMDGTLGTLNPGFATPAKERLRNVDVGLVEALAAAGAVPGVQRLGVTASGVCAIAGQSHGLHLPCKVTEEFSLAPTVAIRLKGLTGTEVAKLSTERFVARGHMDSVEWEFNLPTFLSKTPDTGEVLAKCRLGWTMTVPRKAMAQAQSWLIHLAEKGTDLRSCEITPLENMVVLATERTSGEQFHREIDATLEAAEAGPATLRVMLPWLAWLLQSSGQDETEIQVRLRADGKPFVITTVEAGITRFATLQG